MTEEKKKIRDSKLTQRKFVVPGAAMLTALMNDGLGMGFDFKTMVLFVSASLIYAGIQTWYDTMKLKYAAAKK